MLLTPNSQLFLRIGASFFFSSYVLLYVGMIALFVFGIFEMLAAHALNIYMPHLFFPIFITWAGAFIVSIYTYFGLSFVVRCPACHASLLRIPSGLKPLSVTLQKKPPIVLRLSRWSSQGWDILHYGHVQCVQCEQEYSLAKIKW